MVLLSGITFERYECKLLALKKILMIAQDNSSEVYKHLVKQDLLFVFVDLCLVFDWHSFPDLINSVFLIIKERTLSKNFKEKLVSKDFFRIIIIAIDLKANSDLLCQFIIKFFDDNTLTILQII